MAAERDEPGPVIREDLAGETVYTRTPHDEAGKQMSSHSVSWLSRNRLDAEREDRAAAGWRTFTIEGRTDAKQAFFERVSQSLPLDPPLGEGRRWEALSDSLWSVLDALQQPRILIAWPGAGDMRKAAPKDAEIAISLLSEVAAALADPNVTAGPTTELTILPVE